MSRQRVFFFVFFLVALMATVFFTSLGIRQLTAAPTLSDIVLTNTAVVDWLSGTVNKSTNSQYLSTKVGTNYGVSWIGQASNTIEGGSFMSNITWLSNDGNATADFILSSLSNFAYAASKPWTNWFTNLTDGGAYGDTLSVTISPAGGKNILFMVYAPPEETNRAYITFNCMASNSNAAANLGDGATNYVGMDGTAYGGNMGKWNGMPSVAFLTNGETDFSNWTLSVLVADIVIVKTASFSNTGPFGGITADPYPGALITFRIGYTNQGGLSGTTVRIVDTLPTNYIYFRNDSMRKGTVDQTFADYYTLAANDPTTVEGDDDGSTNNAAADQVIFTPAAGIAPATGGTVVPDGSGAYFFQSYLK